MKTNPVLFILAALIALETSGFYISSKEPLPESAVIIYPDGPPLPPPPSPPPAGAVGLTR